MSQPAAGPDTAGPPAEQRESASATLAAVLGPWDDAALAAALLAVDPHGLGGVLVRGLPGPVRDHWQELVRRLLPPETPFRKIPLHIGDDRLLGGLDLAATLRAGRPVAQRGVLAESDGGVVLLPMAERVATGTAAKLAAVLDNGSVGAERDGLTLKAEARIGAVAYDEGGEDDEPVAGALAERLALHIDLTRIAPRDIGEAPAEAPDIVAARQRLCRVTVPDDAVKALCGSALALGVYSMRIPLLAVRVARAAAALDGRDEVDETDAALAARLVLAPRATQMPAGQEEEPAEQEPEEPEPPPEPPEDQEPPEESEDDEQDQLTPEELAEVILAAAQAAVPPNLLALIQAGLGPKRRKTPAGKAGARKYGATRGRPSGTRAGMPGQNGARLNVIETLRSAAPWQTLRRREFEMMAARAREEGYTPANPPRVLVRRDDFRVMRYRQRTLTTTIFAVDASGSAALHRLAEAKGAVELLLAECYVRRDQVAVVAFRGKGAEVLLPPTRSLVRAKRSLARLPGGGGTPLAAGVETAAMLADAAAHHGQSPVLVMLTDGRANVGLDGKGGRAKAQAEAMEAAGRVRLAGHSALVLDTAPRPDPRARQLAEAMDATYLPLPQADAASISQAVQAAAK
ncbi:magnesium chelatase subunit D [Roseospirillum parvum]|uniref:Mg-protoporphyrin IX chelatase n=1 Tax=Roseospirillum parvum TaxID=83401 RepID=A0A1G8AXV8_9PROT|nr:magnesium chelatase subunit D [Roseospirillum parvum]SDH25636.1 magnesium chelatase subunit D [Roseospirillum parvum]